MVFLRKYKFDFISLSYFDLNYRFSWNVEILSNNVVKY